MVWRLRLLTCAIAVAAAPAAAQEMSRHEALATILREALSEEKMALPFKDESAETYKSPFLPDDTRWEKRAREDWYATQLPEGFPAQGNVTALYLTRCEPNTPSLPLLSESERLDWRESSAATESALILNALATKGIKDLPIPNLAIRWEEGWDRAAADPALRQLNRQLMERYAAGQLPQPVLVLEPFCRPSERGSYQQWEENGSKGAPPPPPPPPPSPAPPPPPPVGPPTRFLLPSGAQAWIATEINARICELEHGTFFHADCQWWKVTGDGQWLSGRKYRYRVLPTSAPAYLGLIDLKVQPSPIDLTR